MNWDSIPVSCRILRRSTHGGEFQCELFFNYIGLTGREIVDLYKDQYPTKRFYFLFDEKVR